MLDFPTLINTNPTEVSGERMPADLQQFMIEGEEEGTMVRGSKAFHTGLQDPRNWFHIYEDFQGFTAADWAITKNGTGGGTTTVANIANGVLAMVVDVADDDDINMQYPNETIMFAQDKPVWFEARIKVDDAILSSIFVGVGETDTTMMPGWQDGAGFFREDTPGDALLDFVSDKDGTPTTVADIHTMTDLGWVNLAFGWNGDDLLVPYVNGVKGTPVTTNICDDEEMTVTFAIQNNSGVSRTMFVDYFDVWQLR